MGAGSDHQTIDFQVREAARQVRQRFAVQQEKAGSRILDELVAHGHQVFAVVRKEGSQSPREGIFFVVDNLTDSSQIAETIEGADALIAFFTPPLDDLEGGASRQKNSRAAAINIIGCPSTWQIKMLLRLFP